MQAYGFVGAPLTAALVAWLQLGMLLAVCRAGGHHRKCWGGWTAEAWRGRLRARDASGHRAGAADVTRGV